MTNDDTHRPHGEHPHLGKCDCDRCQKWDAALYEERNPVTDDGLDLDEAMICAAQLGAMPNYATIGFKGREAERCIKQLVIRCRRLGAMLDEIESQRGNETTKTSAYGHAALYRPRR